MASPRQSLQTLYVAQDAQRRHRDAALLAVQQAERRLAQTLAQGQTLTHYRRDTQQRFGVAQGRPLGAEQVATVHGFTQRLEDALVQFEAVSVQARQDAEHCRTRLTDAQMRLSVLEKLIDRREALLRVRENRQQARDDDERAMALAAAAPSPLAHADPDELETSAWPH